MDERTRIEAVADAIDDALHNGEPYMRIAKLAIEANDAWLIDNDYRAVRLSWVCKTCGKENGPAHVNCSNCGAIPYTRSDD